MMTNTCAWCRKRDLSDLLISRRFRANLWGLSNKAGLSEQAHKNSSTVQTNWPRQSSKQRAKFCSHFHAADSGSTCFSETHRRRGGREGGGWRTPTCCSTLPLARGGCARFRAGKSPDKEFDSRRLPPTTSSFSPRRTEGDNSTVTTFIHKSEGRLARL